MNSFKPVRAFIYLYIYGSIPGGGGGGGGGSSCLLNLV